MGAPLSTSHFRAEGDVEFRSILYIPSKAAFDFYDTYYSRKPAVKLYVRRVFISDEFEDLLPRYLSFLLGLVDSDTLPLNVSREMLQQHASLKTIKKKLVRKALEMMKSMAEAEASARKTLAAGDADADEAVDKESLEKDVKKYESFWNEFGKALKLGTCSWAVDCRVSRMHSFAEKDCVFGYPCLDMFVYPPVSCQSNGTCHCSIM